MKYFSYDKKNLYGAIKITGNKESIKKFVNRLIFFREEKGNETIKGTKFLARTFIESDQFKLSSRYGFTRDDAAISIETFVTNAKPVDGNPLSALFTYIVYCYFEVSAIKSLVKGYPNNKKYVGHCISLQDACKEDHVICEIVAAYYNPDDCCLIDSNKTDEEYIYCDADYISYGTRKMKEYICYTCAYEQYKPSFVEWDDDRAEDELIDELCEDCCSSGLELLTDESVIRINRQVNEHFGEYYICDNCGQMKQFESGDIADNTTCNICFNVESTWSRIKARVKIIGEPANIREFMKNFIYINEIKDKAIYGIKTYFPRMFIDCPIEKVLPDDFEQNQLSFDVIVAKGVIRSVMERNPFIPKLPDNDNYYAFNYDLGEINKDIIGKDMHPITLLDACKEHDVAILIISDDDKIQESIDVSSNGHYDYRCNNTHEE